MNQKLEWRPIKTAPIRKSVLITDGFSMCVAEFSFLEWNPENCYASDSVCTVYTSIEPTHWMPLPQPPEVKP